MANLAKKKKEEEKGGFQFNAPVTAHNQTFINGDVNNLTIHDELSVNDLMKLEELFRPLKEISHSLPPNQRQQAEEHVEELHQELSKGQNANAERLNKIIDGLVEMIPGGLSAVISMFSNPILGALVGPVTNTVLDRLK